jgi:hypothetical protein
VVQARKAGSKGQVRGWFGIYVVEPAYRRRCLARRGNACGNPRAMFRQLQRPPAVRLPTGTFWPGSRLAWLRCWRR